MFVKPGVVVCFQAGGRACIYHRPTSRFHAHCRNHMDASE